jgi:YfiR/HmsC-like
MLLPALISACARAASTPTEYEIKAVFLYHFTQFVAWPEAAFAQPDSPFVIGLVGADPFGTALNSIVGGEAVGRHRLAVMTINDVSAEFRCQILYFTEASENLLDLQRLRTAPVLTVGESDSFYKKGGMIQFFLDRRRVRLKVNLEEARAHSLEISAKLLRVADVTEWDPIRIGVYTMASGAALKPDGRLAEYRPLDLFVSGTWDSEFGMRLVQ